VSVGMEGEIQAPCCFRVHDFGMQAGDVPALSMSVLCGFAGRNGSLLGRRDGGINPSALLFCCSSLGMQAGGLPSAIDWCFVSVWRSEWESVGMEG
jgi:hypothetical protein